MSPLVVLALLTLLTITTPIAGGAAGNQEQQSRPPQTGSTSNPVGGSGATDAKGVGRNSSGIVLNSEVDYRLGPNDTVDVKIEKADELSGTYQITAAGSFLMPFLGRVMAQGKTCEELAAQIADGLRGKYLVEPNVRVTLLQPSSGQSFFIQGAVRAAGLYQIKGRPTLLELITLAGGLTDIHGSTAFLIRKLKQPPGPSVKNDSSPGEPPVEAAEPGEEPAKYEMVKVNITGLLRGNFENNIVVEPGDIVNIPPTDMFFVAGEVNQPGSFPLKEGMTLGQAIALAQGINSRAATNRCIIRREDPTTGKRQEIKIDAGAVMSGKKEDVPLMANDIIVIPNSRAKSIGELILRTVGGAATRVVYR